MIVQCRQCRIKYAFDDALMHGDGIWMRCSRCEHVFFHDNPLKIKQPIDAFLNKASGLTQDAANAQGDGEVSYEEMLNSGKDNDVIQFLDNVMEEKDKYKQEMELEIGKPVTEDISSDVTAAAVVEEAEEFNQNKSTGGRGFWKTLQIAVWSIFVILIIPAIIYFLIFPQYGERFVRVANRYFGTPEPEKKDVVTGQVKMQDIQQRILNNYIIGQIRIVEGTAVNQADYPICRIVIKGEIVDAYAVVLRERSTYAGNILTDEELTTLSEEEILSKLAQPSGLNNSNDNIVPNGHIPFMIIFTHEPPGLIKTTLMTIGAERLL